jgi:hypothetical protein
LGLLARRTQLFHLRAELERHEDIPDFLGFHIPVLSLLSLVSMLMLTFDFLFFWSLNVPIESFPKLLWVVRDFVQDTGELTPTEWLHSLLHSRRRDTSKEDDKISLLSLFPSIEAFTLSLPAGEKKILRRLDLASNDTLSEDYKHDLEQLRYKIFTSITPKTRGGVPLSGFGISFSLVEFLCSQRIRFYSHCVIFQLWHRC